MTSATTLFIDRCAWSGVLGRALDAAAIPHIPHHARFAADAPDEAWLREAAGEQWLVVTRDQRIRYKVNEQEAAVAAGLHLFVFTQGHLPAAETASILVGAYPRMLALATATLPPAFWSLQKSGGVRALHFAQPANGRKGG